MARVALITKLSWFELPYLRSFLSHYLQMGISRFYLLDTSPVEDVRIENALISWYGSYQNFVVLRKYDPQRPYSSDPTDFLGGDYNRFLEEITEEWLVMADIDEFIVPTGGFTIGDLTELIPPKQIGVWFPWIMTPLDNTTPPNGIRKIEGVMGRNGKYMVNKEKIHELNEHSVIVKTGKRFTFGADSLYKKVKMEKLGGWCVHYWSRGLHDVVLKSIGGKYSVKNMNNEDNAGKINLPNRMKLLSVLASKPSEMTLNREVRLDTDSDILYRLIEENIDLSELQSLFDLYEEYKRSTAPHYAHLFPWYSFQKIKNLLP